MITLSAFQEYLSSKVPLPQPASKYINGEEQQLLKWAVTLPTQTEAQQLDQIEKILTELAVSDLEDEPRLKLMGIVATASDRLIASLRQHYINESGALNSEQLQYSAEVKSLYYLSILVYDGIVRRESQRLDYQQRTSAVTGWRQIFSLGKKPPITLASAIYQTLATYQRLLYEQAISYENAQQHLWEAINQLYYLAHRHDITHVNLSEHVVVRQAISIHEIYLQICLHSLLNTRAMRRANIILIHRLLPSWSAHVNATIEPITDTRVFVDLQGSSPPVYLTANSTINPYDEYLNCLFIELDPLASYLQQRQQVLLESGYESIEAQLVAKVLMAIKHRYINRQATIPAKLSPKLRATVITGFDAIHYHVAGGHSLMSMIAAKELPIEQLPSYDTQPKEYDQSIKDKGIKKDTNDQDAKKQHNSIKLYVDTFDSTDTTSQIRLMQLLSAQDIMQRQAIIADRMATRQSNLTKMHKHQPVIEETSLSVTPVELDKTQSNKREGEQGSAPPLSLMSMFLLCRPNDSSKLKWSLGMVRWLNLESKLIEVEWQVLGHELTACALRLDNRGNIDQRSQKFIPAFLMAGDEDLQTDYSVIVPSYRFQTGDRVMMRINDNQEPLRLQQCLINSEEFSQYKFVRL
ncbi:hypothetical protein [Psychrobacter fulvigenes]|uniref:hypothetical protein n=1 Tax=Psychrobacter fulvigenes TaxID=533323 RepID=UPI00191B7819|nr:hypothetical protein [Psychrobacter fulvigenes]